MTLLLSQKTDSALMHRTLPTAQETLRPCVRSDVHDGRSAVEPFPMTVAATVPARVDLRAPSEGSTSARCHPGRGWRPAQFERSGDEERLALVLHSTQSPHDLLHAEVITRTDARCNRVEPRHLSATKLRPLGLRSASERPVERCVGRMGAFEPEDMRYSSERSALVAQNEGLLVKIEVVRHIGGEQVLRWAGFDCPQSDRTRLA